MRYAGRDEDDISDANDTGHATSNGSTPWSVHRQAVLINESPSSHQSPRPLTNHPHICRHFVNESRFSTSEPTDVDIMSSTLQKPNRGEIIRVHLPEGRF